VGLQLTTATARQTHEAQELHDAPTELQQQAANAVLDEKAWYQE
jgi:hypothetical protein